MIPCRSAHRDARACTPPTHPPLSQAGNENGEPKLPVVVVAGGSVPRGTHPREYLKAIERPKNDGEDGRKKVMRYSSTYRHTGLIGH